MEKNKTITSKVEIEYPWVEFAQSYLSMARLGCEEMIQNKYKEDVLETGKMFDSYKVTTIFIPTLYNIKHGIEVFTKFLQLTLAGKLLKGDKIHDIAELFRVLEVEFKRHKIGDVLEGRLKQKPRDSDLNIAVKDAGSLNIFLTTLKELITQYYHCVLFQKKMGDDFLIEDVKNDAFRYPDNSMMISIDYLQVVERISKEEIREMKEDVDKLIDNFNSLGYIVTIYKKNVQK